MRSTSRSSNFSAFTLIELLVVVAIIAILAAILFPVFAQAREKARQTACLSNLKQMGTAVMMYASDFDETMPLLNYGVLDANKPKWMDLVAPYVKNTDIYTCPSGKTAPQAQFLPYTDPRRNTTGCCPFESWYYGTYGINEAYWGGEDGANNPVGQPLAAIQIPADTIAVAESEIVQGNANIGWQNVSQNPYVERNFRPLAMRRRNDYWPLVLLRHSEMANGLFCDGHAKAYKGEALAATHTVNGKNIAYLWTIQED